MSINNSQSIDQFDDFDNLHYGKSFNVYNSSAAQKKERYDKEGLTIHNISRTSPDVKNQKYIPAKI
tara:strand:+ start:956 stop:1153 length:198 start_codon:yes stop_codon:yes gene_type:complete